MPTDINIFSRNLDMNQGSYQQTSGNRDEIFKVYRRKNQKERIRNEKIGI